MTYVPRIIILEDIMNNCNQIKSHLPTTKCIFFIFVQTYTSKVGLLCICSSCLQALKYLSNGSPCDFRTSFKIYCTNKDQSLER